MVMDLHVNEADITNGIWPWTSSSTKQVIQVSRSEKSMAREVYLEIEIKVSSTQKQYKLVLFTTATLLANLGGLITIMMAIGRFINDNLSPK